LKSDTSAPRVLTAISRAYNGYADVLDPIKNGPSVIIPMEPISMPTTARPLLLLVLWLVATVGHSAAQSNGPTPNVNDGDALLRECGVALRAADGGPIIDPNPLTRGVDMGQCLGLVSAVWHTHKLMVDTFNSREAFCPSGAISAGEMARLVHAYLTRQPVDLERWDTELILEAFGDAYPCH